MIICVLPNYKPRVKGVLAKSAGQLIMFGSARLHLPAQYNSPVP